MTESPHGFAKPSEEEPNAGQADEDGEIAPDRPSGDAEDLSSAVQKEEAKEQSRI